MAQAVAGTMTALLAVAAFCWLMAAVGSRVLGWAGVPRDDPGEFLLLSIGLGVVLFELDCLFLAVVHALRPGVVVLLVACVLLSAAEARRLKGLFAQLWRNNREAPRGAKWVQGAFAAVLLYEGLTAMAPLTGSDAMHYHFTVPRLILGSGFHANFFVTHSFLTGQGHLLILAGLALGSEKFAMGLMYLGGVLAALAAGCLARRWMPAAGAWLVALTFVLTPVAFWQMSMAGTPDLWMAFFATMGVLMIARVAETGHVAHVLLAGMFAGAIAGTKYTGCVIAASLALALARETRSWKALGLFSTAAVSAGMWMYVRNFLWTGDPVFPFLMRWVHPGQLNAYTMASLLADTGAAGKRTILDVLRFPVFAAIQTGNPGLWQFLGPICLCFAPLMFFAVRRTPLWRTTLTVWLVSTAGIGLTSGMLRFTLPVYPLALAAVFAGVWAIPERGWSLLRGSAWATVALFLTMSAGGLLLYGRRAVVAALGGTSREAYLSAAAPDFAKAQFVNSTLQGRQGEGKALVFFRHVYHLQVPYVYGDPDASWAVDPERLRSDAAWKEFFQRVNIRWVVKAPEYPKAIAGPLEQLEEQGVLTRIAQREIEDFSGNRILGVRKHAAVVILEVRQESTAKR